MSTDSNKKLKYKIVDYLENNFSNCKISKKTCGTLLRGFHISAPLNILFAMFYIPKIMFIIFLIFF